MRLGSATCRGGSQISNSSTQSSIVAAVIAGKNGLAPTSSSLNNNNSSSSGSSGSKPEHSQHLRRPHHHGQQPQGSRHSRERRGDGKSSHGHHSRRKESSASAVTASEAARRSEPKRPAERKHSQQLPERPDRSPAAVAEWLIKHSVASSELSPAAARPERLPRGDENRGSMEQQQQQSTTAISSRGSGGGGLGGSGPAVLLRDGSSKVSGALVSNSPRNSTASPLSTLLSFVLGFKMGKNYERVSPSNTTLKMVLIMSKHFPMNFKEKELKILLLRRPRRTSLASHSSTTASGITTSGLFGSSIWDQMN